MDRLVGGLACASPVEPSGSSSLHHTHSPSLPGQHLVRHTIFLVSLGSHLGIHSLFSPPTPFFPSIFLFVIGGTGLECLYDGRGQSFEVRLRYPFSFSTSSSDTIVESFQYSFCAILQHGARWSVVNHFRPGEPRGGDAGILIHGCFVRRRQRRTGGDVDAFVVVEVRISSLRGSQTMMMGHHFPPPGCISGLETSPCGLAVGRTAAAL